MWIAAGLTAVGGLVALFWLPETRAARTGAGDPLAEGTVEGNSLRKIPAEAGRPLADCGRETPAEATSPHVSRFTLHALWVAAAWQGPWLTYRHGEQAAYWTTPPYLGEKWRSVPYLGDVFAQSRPDVTVSHSGWQGINRFAISGVLGATLGLVVQEHWQSARWRLGVATLTGALAAGRTLFSMAAAPLAGTASDWVGSRWKVLGWGLGVGVASMALMAWGVPAAILVGVSLGAVTSGSVQGLTSALAGDLAGQAQRGRAVGLVNTAGDLGSALGPPIAYALLPGMGLPGVYLLCAGLFVVGCALALWFQAWRSGRKECGMRNAECGVSRAKGAQAPWK
jgi:hypothetical protein